MAVVIDVAEYFVRWHDFRIEMNPNCELVSSCPGPILA